MKSLSGLALILFAINCFCQAPQAFNYQGVARDDQGTEMHDHIISLRISIRNVSATGPIEFQEAHTTKTNEFGLFNIQIGNGGPITSDLSSVDWSIGQKWLQIEMDTTGGTNYLDMGSSQLLSTPYALYAGNAGGATTLWTQNGDTLSYTNGPIGIGTATPTHKLTVADTVEITSGGLMFPDGSVQTSAAKSDSSIWEINDNNIFLKDFNPDKIVIGQSSIFDNNAFLAVKSTNQVTNGSGGIISRVASFEHSVDYQYKPQTSGPRLKVSNSSDDQPVNSSVSIELTTVSNSPTVTEGAVQLTNVNRGGNAADLAFQCEYDGGSNADFREVARFTSEGNVGIGTAAPTHKLTVTDTLEITSGGLMFPDGSVQTSAAKSDSSYWERLDVNTLGLATSDNVRINIPSGSFLDNSEVKFGVSSDAYINDTHVYGIPFWALCNVDYQYNPATLGPNIRILNHGIQSNTGSSMGLTISTRDIETNGSTGGDAMINAVNAGQNAAHFTIQCEYEGPNAIDLREVARFTSGGNVGIGTAIPTHKLTVTDTVEITSGGLMFPDGSVQTSAAKSDSSYWKLLDENTLGLATSDNVRINILANSVLDNTDVKFGVKSDAYLDGSFVKGIPFWAMCNIDYQYDPNEAGPNIKLLNRGTQTNAGSTMGIVISSYDAQTNGSTGADVILNNINAGFNAADFAIRCEYNGSNPTDYREVARFTSEGNVGINNPDAKEKLHITDGNIYLDNAANGVIMTSPDGTCYLMQVANGGTPTFSPVGCP